MSAEVTSRDRPTRMLSRSPVSMALAVLHATGASTDVTTGGSSNADAVHPVHTWPTVFADGSDRAICLFEVGERHSECRCRQGQSKRSRYQLRHYFSPGVPLATTKHCVCYGDFDLGQECSVLDATATNVRRGRLGLTSASQSSSVRRRREATGGHHITGSLR